MSLNIKFIPAQGGDCIFIQHTHLGSHYNILIDGGTAKTHLKIKHEITNIKGLIDLVIISHRDDDHIGGIKAMFNDPDFNFNTIKEVWVNHSELIEIPSSDSKIRIEYLLSVKKKLTDNNIKITTITDASPTKTIGELNIKILSPSIEKQNAAAIAIKEIEDNTVSSNSDHEILLSEFDISKFTTEKFVEDSSITNGSSIAVLIEYQNKKFLFAADAHPSVLIKNILQAGYNVSTPLKLELFKLSHHGSKYNTNKELLDIISCSNYILCANGVRHNFPNKSTLAAILRNPNRIINEPINFYFPEETEKLDLILQNDPSDIVQVYNFDIIYQTDFQYNDNTTSNSTNTSQE